MNTTTDNPIPDIPGWEIVDLLGRGGMGAVYRARSKTLSQLVALKVIDPLYASQPAFRHCFLREISTSVALHHAHILPILNFSPDPDSGSLFFVTPIVGTEDCRSLADLIARNGKLDPGLAASLLAQVADALAHAHSLESPLIHRDVSPSNILLKTTRSGSYHALLADFGIAFPGTQEAREAVTDPESLIPSAGKPQYMAPEQFDDVEFGPMTARTDLYQLGIVAYECLAGDLPYQETNPIRLSDCHRRAEVPRLTPEQCPDPRWRQLVTELLAKKPGDRPEDAATVRNRLFDIAREPQVDLPEPPAVERKPESEEPSPHPLPPTLPETPSATSTPLPAPDSEAPTDILPPPSPTMTRRPTPATVVQAARPTDTAPLATAPRPRRKVGRWVLLLLGLLIPVAVLAFQFRASLFGPGPDPTPIVRDDPVSPTDTDPAADDSEEPAEDTGETTNEDTPPVADETGEETTGPVTPDDQEVADNEEEPGDDSPDLSAAPLEYRVGPEQRRFEELLARACRRLELTDAEIEAVRSSGWSPPQDTPHEALDNLLALAQPAFASATNTRSLYEKGPESLREALAAWIRTEQAFADWRQHWEAQQSRSLLISLNLRSHRDEHGQQVGEREILVTLTRVGSDEAAAELTFDTVVDSFFPITQSAGGNRPITGPHRVQITTTDRLQTFRLDTSGADPVESDVFDFGGQFPPYPVSESGSPTIQPWYVIDLTDEERQTLRLRRADVRIGTLREEVTALLAKGAVIYADVEEKSRQAGERKPQQMSEEEHDQVKGDLLRDVNDLCLEWDGTILAPVNNLLDELSSLRSDLAPLGQQTINLGELGTFISKSRDDLSEQDPNVAREEVLRIIQGRKLQGDEDDG